jgi:hypothetical protein
VDVDASSSKLLDGETASSADLHIVALSRAADNRSEILNRAGSCGSKLELTRIAAGNLPRGVIQPRPTGSSIRQQGS